MIETTGAANAAAPEPPLSDAAVQAQPRQPGRLAALGAWLSSPLNLFITLLALVPPIAIAWFIIERGVNMPYLDQWENSVLIALRAADGTLTPADVLRQNFDHRLVFSNLLTLFLTYTTNWNLKVEMFVVFGVALANLGLLAALFRLHSQKLLVAALIPFSLLIFMIRANSIWVWSMLISTPLSMMFLLLGLLILRRYPVGWKPLIGAAVCAICMSLCLLQGFIGWPLLLLALLMLGYRKPAYLGVWVALAAISIALYFTNYDFSLLGADEEGNSAGLVTNAGKLIGYTFTYMGNPFVMPEGEWRFVASGVAAAGLVLGLLNATYLWLRTRRLTDLTVWLVLGLWAWGSGFLTAFGRSHVFPDLLPQQPLIDRYVPPPALFWIAFIAIAILVLGRIAQGDRTAFTRLLMVANIALLVVITPLYGYVNFMTLNRERPMPPGAEDCMLRFQATRNVRCLARSYLKQTTLPDLVERIDGLASHQLAAFAGIRPLYTENVALYTVERMVTVGANSAYRLYDPNESQQFFVYQQPAPGQTEFLVTIPDTDQPIILGGGVTWDVVEGNRNADGIIQFRVGVRMENDTSAVLGTITYDPAVDNGIKPLRISLNDYRGQTVRIVLQTSNPDNQPTNLPLWIDPVVFVATTE